MKRSLTIKFLFLTSVFGLLCPFFYITAVYSAPGDTTVCKWKGNKKGAFTMTFDDSLPSNANYIIPNFISRGLAGTFFVVPDAKWIMGYGFKPLVWESLCSRTGMDLQPHGMTHGGVSNDLQADYELGECAKYIWTLWTSTAVE